MQVPYVFDTHFHHIWVSEPKNGQGVDLNETIGVVNHYRDDFDGNHGKADRDANTFDDAILSEAPMLEKALTKRFGQPLYELWDRLR